MKILFDDEYTFLAHSNDDVHTTTCTLKIIEHDIFTMIIATQIFKENSVPLTHSSDMLVDCLLAKFNLPRDRTLFIRHTDDVFNGPCDEVVRFQMCWGFPQYFRPSSRTILPSDMQSLANGVWPDYIPPIYREKKEK